MKKYKIKDLLSGATYEWTVRDILNEINRDRSSEWTDYDETDWREGWNQWVEGEYLSIQEAEPPRLSRNWN
jgi:hypothetical protein